MAGGLYAAPSSITRLQKKKTPNKWGETKGAGWVGHTPPPLMIQPRKKKRIPPFGGGNEPEWGWVPPPSMKKRKIKRQHVGCTLPRRSPRRRASGQRERKKTRRRARCTLPHRPKKRENETACGKHAASSTSGEGEPAGGKN